MPKVCGHRGPVTDIKRNPFNDYMIASCSDDTTIKIWQMPAEELTGNLTDWFLDLEGRTKKVGYIEWHQTAEDILLNAGNDDKCLVWNVVESERARYKFVPDTSHSIWWNRDGSLVERTRVTVSRLKQGVDDATSKFDPFHPLIVTGMGFEEKAALPSSLWSIGQLTGVEEDVLWSVMKKTSKVDATLGNALRRSPSSPLSLVVGQQRSQTQLKKSSQHRISETERLDNRSEVLTLNNNATHTDGYIPKGEDELRRVYFLQRDEIHHLKEELNMKEVSIQQLEEEAKRLRVTTANKDSCEADSDSEEENYENAMEEHGLLTAASLNSNNSNRKGSWICKLCRTMNAPGVLYCTICSMTRHELTGVSSLFVPNSPCLNATDPYHQTLTQAFSDVRGLDIRGVDVNLSVGNLGRHTLSISRIDQNVNVPLLRSYAVKKQEMLERNRGVINEMYVCHGTALGDVQSILQFGHDRAYSHQEDSVTTYGKGPYFANVLGHALKYAHPAAHGLRAMIISRILAGKWTVGQDTDFVPPMRSATERYDCTVDDVSSPSIFVTYNDAQTFPAFVVYFRLV